MSTIGQLGLWNFATCLCDSRQKGVDPKCACRDDRGDDGGVCEKQLMGRLEQKDPGRVRSGRGLHRFS